MDIFTISQSGRVQLTQVLRNKWPELTHLKVFYISQLCAFLSRVFHQDHTQKQTQKASYLDCWGGQITRRMLGLTRLVGRVVKITGVMRVLKHIINWTPIKPAQVTFHSVFLGYGGDLVCSEIRARV